MCLIFCHVLSHSLVIVSRHFPKVSERFARPCGRSARRERAVAVDKGPTVLYVSGVDVVVKWCLFAGVVHARALSSRASGGPFGLWKADYARSWRR